MIKLAHIIYSLDYSSYELVEAADDIEAEKKVRKHLNIEDKPKIKVIIKAVVK